MKLDLLPFEWERHTLRPDFLDARDHPWLTILVDEYRRFVGRKERELDARLHQALPAAHPLKKRLLAQAVLDKCWRRAARQGVGAAKVRQVVFRSAALMRAQGVFDRPRALSEGAQALGLSPAEIEGALFGDLPGERTLAEAAAPPSVSELVLRANLLLVKALMGRAASCTFTLFGATRPVIRQAKLRGLICVIEGSGDELTVHVSGPMSLLAHTTLYGRALGELVAPLAACKRFRFEAALLLGGRSVSFSLGSGAPIFPAEAARAFDSALEARFAKDFLAAAPAWDLIREPRPVAAGPTLIFPDFELRERAPSGRRWYVEILGFWTVDYLAKKLAHYRAAKLANLILCIDAGRNCAPGELPLDARVVAFRKRIDPHAVLAIIGGDGTAPHSTLF